MVAGRAALCVCWVLLRPGGRLKMVWEQEQRQGEARCGRGHRYCSKHGPGLRLKAPIALDNCTSVSTRRCDCLLGRPATKPAMALSAWAAALALLALSVSSVSSSTGVTGMVIDKAARQVRAHYKLHDRKDGRRVASRPPS